MNGIYVDLVVSFRFSDFTDVNLSHSRIEGGDFTGAIFQGPQLNLTEMRCSVFVICPDGTNNLTTTPGECCTGQGIPYEGP